MTISSVLPDTTGTRGERIKDINHIHIFAGHLRISGQCNECVETNHVTQTCRHEHAVSCFVMLDHIFSNIARLRVAVLTSCSNQ